MRGLGAGDAILSCLAEEEGRGVTNSLDSQSKGALVINGDDWGCDRDTTDRIMHCTRTGAISSVSAMVFMKDAERAAELAQENGIDAGLHLNLVTPFDSPGCSSVLKSKLEQLHRHLLGNRFSQVVFNPLLMKSFEYVVAAQLEEYRRLYGVDAQRIDGHHHMHLSANVLLQNLLPSGTIVRRSFSFQKGEKSAFNRFYRGLVDRKLARKHRLTDYFFSLPPLEPVRLQRIFALSQQAIVEVEAHPVRPEEYKFLLEGGVFLSGGRQPEKFSSIASLMVSPGSNAKADIASVTS
jgi:predicted glycoside hydrolase/deacetylase ChbG (UPF0249 family)